MIIYRAYRYELDPNNIQRTLLHKHAGVARFAYNWGFKRRIRLYKENQGRERFTNAME
jgi:putative transposase